jgi:AcrB/AcrD/AcrF family
MRYPTPDYTLNSYLNDKVATALVIRQRPGSNALATAATASLYIFASRASATSWSLALGRLSHPGQFENIMISARDYSMRVWLDPAKVAERGLTAGEVVAALRSANLQVAAGVVCDILLIPRATGDVMCTTIMRMICVR